MSDKLSGSPAEVLSRVQEVFASIVPGAVCELQDYEFRIGCGAMDRWGNLQDVKFQRNGLTEEEVRYHAQVLSRMVESGGSTAGPPVKTDC